MSSSDSLNNLSSLPITPMSEESITPDYLSTDGSSVSDFCCSDNEADDTTAAKATLSEINGAADLELDYVQICTTLTAAARHAGALMLAASRAPRTSTSKLNSSDRVTATDRAIEAAVRARLAAAHPRVRFLGEETSSGAGARLTSAPTFVVDPIDGTLNFIHGLPNAAVSLALCVARQPVVGVVYNPFRGDLFSAVRGHGAFLTHVDASLPPTAAPPTPPLRLPLGCAGGAPPPLRRGLNDALVALEWGSERHGANWALRTRVARRLLTAAAEGGAMCHSVRSMGSAALDMCAVAAGWVDAFWEGGCWAWDVAAGWAIVEEAGGLVAGANPGVWEPEVDGRCYLAVRGVGPEWEEEEEEEEEEGKRAQRCLVEEIWTLMEGEKFVFAN